MQHINHMLLPDAACIHMFLPDAACIHMLLSDAACIHMLLFDTMLFITNTCIDIVKESIIKL